MPTTDCGRCKLRFHYDEELGLNVAYFEGKSTSTYFQASGTMPCCPQCEGRCSYESKNIEIKYSRFAMPIKELKINYFNKFLREK